MANDLTKEWFLEYILEFGEIYPNPVLTDKKISIYYNFFSSKGFVKLQYEAAKKEIFRRKKDLYFPSMAEIIDNIKVDKEGKEWN